MGGSAKRNTLIVRVLRLVELLRSRWLSIEEAARELGEHPRTIYRDFAALQEAQLPITERRGDVDARCRQYRILG